MGRWHHQKNAVVNNYFGMIFWSACTRPLPCQASSICNFDRVVLLELQFTKLMRFYKPNAEDVSEKEHM